MSFLYLLLKGFIVGLGKVIPGVSGSLIAIFMGIYDKSIYYINNFFKDTINGFKYLLPIFIGLILSIVLGSRLISYLLNSHYLEVMSLFIGLIIGGIKQVVKLVGKFNLRTWLIFLISFNIILLPFLFTNNAFSFNQSINTYFLIGIIDSITMIVPGISGTAVLLTFDLYDELLALFSNLFLLENYKYILSYGIGLIMAGFITIKIIDFLFKRYKRETYTAILGLSCSSIILLIKDVFATPYPLSLLYISFIFLIIGFLISNFLFN